jgi:hypothetical protein
MAMLNGNWVDEFHSAFDAWDKQFLVTSNDIDGFLSAAAIIHHCRQEGAEPTLIGIYTGRHIALFDGHTTDDARNALWLDHDISNPGVICMGQHLVRLHPKDTLPRRHRPTFNPNLWWPGLAHSNCFNGYNKEKLDKYPFATIHYVMAALGITEPNRGSTAYALLAHADSAWSCGYSYQPNCQMWYDAMFTSSNQVVKEITNQTYCDPGNLAVHQALVQELVLIGIKKASSANKPSPHLPSGWNSIAGNQGLRFASNSVRDTWMGRFSNLWGFILSNMGWPATTPNEITSVISGTFNQEYPNRIANLDDLLDDAEVFSHAITGLNSIKYTTDLKI